MILKTFNEQIERLEQHLNSKLMELAKKDYWVKFEKINDNQFIKICDWLIDNFKQTSYKKFPRINDIQEVKTMFFKQKNGYINCEIPEVEMATPEDVKQFFSVLTEIGEWIKYKLAKYNNVYKHFSEGLRLHYDKPTFAKYCEEYREMLKRQRQERIKEAA